MIFAHDTEVSLQAAVELANSGVDPDTLETPEALDMFWTKFDYTGRHDGDRAELDAVRALRGELRALLTAERDHAVDLVNAMLADAQALPQLGGDQVDGVVNAMLADAQALPQLARHGDWDWHLHAVSNDAPLATRIAVETAMAMVDVIRSDEMSRLGICADDGCGGVVLDLSRNRSRRFCSTACGNRNAVAAYRARQAKVGG